MARLQRRGSSLMEGQEGVTHRSLCTLEREPRMDAWGSLPQYFLKKAVRS